MTLKEHEIHALIARCGRNITGLAEHSTVYYDDIAAACRRIEELCAEAKKLDPFTIAAGGSGGHGAAASF